METFELHPISVFVVAPPLIAACIEKILDEARPVLTRAGSAADFASASQSMSAGGADVITAFLLEGVVPSALADFCAASSAKVLIATNSQDEALIDEAVLSGVRGVLNMNDPPAVLVKAIEKVHEGELWIDRNATSRIFLKIARRNADRGPEDLALASLTVRERQTLSAVVRHAGEPGKAVASRLCISEHTLRNHLTSIYTKLGLSNRLALHEFASRHRLCAQESGS